MNWISVTERLPEHGVQCLVCNRYGQVETADYDHNAKAWYDEESYIIRPSHWMPFPKPPEGAIQ